MTKRYTQPETSVSHIEALFIMQSASRIGNQDTGAPIGGGDPGESL